MSVLFETGELNSYVHDGGGLYRRKYVRTEGKRRTTTITLADGKLLPCVATRGFLHTLSQMSPSVGHTL